MITTIILSVLGGLGGGLATYFGIRKGCKDYCRHWGLDFKTYWAKFK